MRQKRDSRKKKKKKKRVEKRIRFAMIPHDLQSVRGKSTLRKKKKKTKTTPMEEKDGTLSQNVGHHQQVETKSDKLKSLEAYLENRSVTSIPSSLLRVLLDWTSHLLLIEFQF